MNAFNNWSRSYIMFFFSILHMHERPKDFLTTDVLRVLLPLSQSKGWLWVLDVVGVSGLGRSSQSRAPVMNTIINKGIK